MFLFSLHPLLTCTEYRHAALSHITVRRVWLSISVIGVIVGRGVLQQQLWHNGEW